MASPEWYQQNRERVLARSKARYEAKKTEILAQTKARRLRDPANREKMREYQRDYREENRERLNEYQREWTRQHPEARRRKQLKLYDMTPEEYDARLEKQGGVCAGCGGPPTVFDKFVVDHDHVTEQVRGLLCHHCNCVLGWSKDNPETLEKLASYLRTRSV